MLKRILNFKYFKQITTVCNLYTPASFGLAKFIEFRKIKQQKLDTEYVNTLKQKLTNTIETKKSIDLDIQDIKQFLFCLNENNISNDFKIALDAFKIYLKENYLLHDYHMGDLIAKTDYLLNEKQANTAIQLINDPELKSSLMSETNSFILMIKLYNHKKYNEVFQCFMGYIDQLESKPTSPEYRIKSQKQSISFGHLRLVTASLLNLNTKESFQNMNLVIEKSIKLKSILNNSSLASCFLLALNMNDLNLAANLVNKIYSNLTLKLNLEIILYSELSRCADAAKLVEKLLNIQYSTKNEFQGKFFKLTHLKFKQMLLTADDESNKKYFKFTELMNRKLFQYDLFEYCTEKHKSFNK